MDELKDLRAKREAFPHSPAVARLERRAYNALKRVVETATAHEAELADLPGDAYRARVADLVEAAYPAETWVAPYADKDRGGLR